MALLRSVVRHARGHSVIQSLPRTSAILSAGEKVATIPWSEHVQVKSDNMAKLHDRQRERLSSLRESANDNQTRLFQQVIQLQGKVGSVAKTAATLQDHHMRLRLAAGRHKDKVVENDRSWIGVYCEPSFRQLRDNLNELSASLQTLVDDLKDMEGALPSLALTVKTDTAEMKNQVHLAIQNENELSGVFAMLRNMVQEDYHHKFDQLTANVFLDMKQREHELEELHKQDHEANVKALTKELDEMKAELQSMNSRHEHERSAKPQAPKANTSAINERSSRFRQMLIPLVLCLLPSLWLWEVFNNRGVARCDRGDVQGEGANAGTEASSKSAATRSKASDTPEDAHKKPGLLDAISLRVSSCGWIFSCMGQRDGVQQN
eukprot:TRINITY_DN74764_c0_g1_i1.p1 TRINITY_DN74764_c0_g1~~TRINITY_DN74764_c0_g1_i1.p1  ORF type:complete len:377 (-),score=52.23 TRINITY_DN74764_c0_g1_i1:100-1230(-)